MDHLMGQSISTFQGPSWSLQILYKSRDIIISKGFIKKANRLFRRLPIFWHWQIARSILITKFFFSNYFQMWQEKINRPQIWYMFDYGDSGILNIFIIDHQISGSILASVDSFFKRKLSTLRIENHHQHSHICNFFYRSLWKVITTFIVLRSQMSSIMKVLPR